MSDTTPILGAAAGVHTPSRWRRARWLAFLLSMLAFHTYPLSDLVHRGWGPAALVAVLVPETVLAVLWVRTMWLAMATRVPFRAVRGWLWATVGLGTAMALVLGGQYKGLMIYVSIACAVTVPVRWTLPALAGSALVGFAAEFRNPRYLGLPPGNRLDEIVTGVSLVFFLGLMMAFYRRAMLLITELRAARGELARLAVTEERLRFARDLHDLLGHSLTTIALKGQVARRLAEPGSAVAGEVADIEAVAQQALTEVREAVTGYRGRSFARELDAARSALAAGGVTVTERLDAAPPTPDVDVLLGWVIREGATNVLRHSGARSCDVTLSGGAGMLTLTITDDGAGPAGPAAPGNGLSGLAERVAGLGGRLTYGPNPARGFHLSACLPESR